jgi:hypothetical protein
MSTNTHDARNFHMSSITRSLSCFYGNIGRLSEATLGMVQILKPETGPAFRSAPVTALDCPCFDLPRQLATNLPQLGGSARINNLNESTYENPTTNFFTARTAYVSTLSSAESIIITAAGLYS